MRIRPVRLPGRLGSPGPRAQQACEARLRAAASASELQRIARPSFGVTVLSAWSCMQPGHQLALELGFRDARVGARDLGTLHREPGLVNGVLPISNAHVERLLRSVALFRKN